MSWRATQRFSSSRREMVTRNSIPHAVRQASALGLPANLFMLCAFAVYGEVERKNASQLRRITGGYAAMWMRIEGVSEEF